MEASRPRTAYLFLDEGGNLDFSPGGTRYFMLTSVLTVRPFELDKVLPDLKFDIIESGIDKEYFHATEDEQSTRDLVFKQIAKFLPNFLVENIIVEKAKVGPTKRGDAHFYPAALGFLVKMAVARLDTSKYSNLIVITDRIPVQKKRQAVEKAIKTTLAPGLPKKFPYRIYHHDSKSCCGLQIADYFNWAIYRKWDRGDFRSYDLISSAIKAERDLLADRQERHY